jgi:hypothetical protein
VEAAKAVIPESYAMSFHEKAGECQDGFFFFLPGVFAFELIRLCRHPSIRTLL